MSRIRKVNDAAVYRTTEFLVDLKMNAHPHNTSQNYCISDLHKIHHVSKSAGSICKKLKWIKQTDKYLWWWIGPEIIERKHALIVMDVLLKQASKRIDVALDDIFVTAIERLTTSMNILSTQNERCLKGTMLGRALNQPEQKMGNTLFSEVQSEQDKKFELLKAVAGGWFSQSDFITPYQLVNDNIILATEDLFNKFFKVK